MEAQATSTVSDGRAGIIRTTRGEQTTMDGLLDVLPLVTAFNKLKPFEDGFTPPTLEPADIPLETPAVDGGRNKTSTGVLVAQ